MQNTISPGTAKRIILLGFETTIRYLQLQIADVLHDTSPPIPYEPVHVADLIATWLYENNTVLHAWDFASFKKSLSYKLFKEDRGSYVDKDHGELSAAARYNVREENIAGVLMDGCDPNTGSSVICKNKDKYYVVSISSMYDSGSSDLCGRLTFMRNGLPYIRNNIADITRDSDGNYMLPEFSNANLRAYLDDRSIIQSCTHLVEYKCSSYADHAKLKIRDFAILGTLPLPDGTVQTVVLGYRGCQTLEDGETTYMTYPYRVCDQKVIKHCKNTSQKSLRPLHMALKAVASAAPANASDTEKRKEQARRETLDKLYLYTELMSKHWGDLGLMMECININGLYLLSVDKNLLRLAVLFRVSYITNNRKYTAPLTAVHRKVVAEENGGSIFNRSSYNNTFTIEKAVINDFINAGAPPSAVVKK